jgi:hypothetical protein
MEERELDIGGLEGDEGCKENYVTPGPMIQPMVPWQVVP